jgi:hypothetical protein
LAGAVGQLKTHDCFDQPWVLSKCIISNTTKGHGVAYDDDDQSFNFCQIQNHRRIFSWLARAGQAPIQAGAAFNHV